jgi:hypothetical protein
MCSNPAPAGVPCAAGVWHPSICSSAQLPELVPSDLPPYGVGQTYHQLLTEWMAPILVQPGSRELR